MPIPKVLGDVVSSPVEQFPRKASILHLHQPVMPAPVPWRIGDVEVFFHVWTQAEWLAMSLSEQERLGRQAQHHANGCYSLPMVRRIYGADGRVIVDAE